MFYPILLYSWLLLNALISLRVSPHFFLKALGVLLYSPASNFLPQGSHSFTISITLFCISMPASDFSKLQPDSQSMSLLPSMLHVRQDRNQSLAQPHTSQNIANKFYFLFHLEQRTGNWLASSHATPSKNWGKGEQTCHKISHHFECGFSLGKNLLGCYRSLTGF